MCSPFFRSAPAAITRAVVAGAATSGAAAFSPSRIPLQQRRRSCRTKRSSCAIIASSVGSRATPDSGFDLVDATRAQQQALPVIGYLNSETSDLSRAFVAAFLRGLADGWHIVGKNVAGVRHAATGAAGRE